MALQHIIPVKRVIGLPGETVKIENGKIYINNKELKGFFRGRHPFSRT
ncbi:MAG: S26 family signal peptidase [Anaerobutyricum hallii]